MSVSSPGGPARVGLAAEADAAAEAGERADAAAERSDPATRERGNAGGARRAARAQYGSTWDDGLIARRARPGLRGRRSRAGTEDSGEDGGAGPHAGAGTDPDVNGGPDAKGGVGGNAGAGRYAGGSPAMAAAPGAPSAPPGATAGFPDAVAGAEDGKRGARGGTGRLRRRSGYAQPGYAPEYAQPGYDQAGYTGPGYARSAHPAGADSARGYGPGLWPEGAGGAAITGTTPRQELYGPATESSLREAAELLRRLNALRELVVLSRTRLERSTLAEAGRVLEDSAVRRRLPQAYTVVAIAGATGSGKSSVFNALAGARLSAVGTRRPTTAVPVACVWEAGESAGSSDALLDRLGVAPRARRRVQPRDTALNGLVLIDLPDCDSVAQGRRQQVDRLLGMVDAMIWVVDPEKYADALLHERYLRPLAGYADVTYVVLNQIDRLPGEAGDQVLHDLRRLLDEDGMALHEHGEPGATVLALSTLTGEGIDELRGALSGLVAGRAAPARRLAADVDGAAARLRPAYVAPGASGLVGLTERARQQFEDRLASAVGATAAGQAAERAWLRRAERVCGTPWTQLLRWYEARQAERRGEPLAACHRAAPDDGAAHWTVARPVLAEAVRALADDAVTGLPEPWAKTVRDAAWRGAEGLPEALEQAVSERRPGGPRPGAGTAGGDRAPGRAGRGLGPGGSAVAPREPVRPTAAARGSGRAAAGAGQTGRPAAGVRGSGRAAAGVRDSGWRSTGAGEPGPLRRSVGHRESGGYRQSGRSRESGRSWKSGRSREPGQSRESGGAWEAGAASGALGPRGRPGALPEAEWCASDESGAGRRAATRSHSPRPPRSPRWWTVAGFGQGLLMAIQLLGLCWLVGAVLGLHDLGRWLPAVLLMGSAVGGPLLAWACRLTARGPARSYGLEEELRLRRLAAGCGRALVLEPVAAELLRYREVREQYVIVAGDTATRLRNDTGTWLRN